MGTIGTLVRLGVLNLFTIIFSKQGGVAHGEHPFHARGLSHAACDVLCGTAPVLGIFPTVLAINKKKLPTVAPTLNPK